MAEQILWKANTTFHDWSDGKFIHQLLDQAIDLGLLGAATWRKIGIRGETEAIAPQNIHELTSHLPTPLPDEPPHSYLELGGDRPSPWVVKLSISPWDEEENLPTTMSSIWLFFAKKSLATASHSQKLFDAFCQIHHPDNTEYACIHPYQHWLDFANQHYQPPVTIGPMFKGVFWANFLGTGHLGEFDLEKLANIANLETKWINNQGLFFKAKGNILDIANSSHEAELKQLTKIFRDAIRLDSKWR